ncbi:hypothetical protein AAY72_03485 [Alishewanella sp. WH16-1]|uniref:HvfA family oxazolone/thioamide-modified RiPP metallophore n=1 Tax=Alishewanella sp. WH16-1 TaxID=1651088 RepID=UPI00070AD751|nr:hypothetical protein [Alishewanella sp. WH16-1]KRS22410.1 hypothetical protein AAY72_03485 [Alishewanella sp. WH16-1]
MNKLNKAQLTLALGAITLASGSALADSNPFQAQQLSMAYQVTTQDNTGVKVKVKEQATDKAKEMKCGEGKCGAEMQQKMADAKKQAADKAKEMKCGEGKCGEGKCGAEMHNADAKAKAAEAKAAGQEKAADAKKKASDKAKEMKCGEGKCGSL